MSMKCTIFRKKILSDPIKERGVHARNYTMEMDLMSIWDCRGRRRRQAIEGGSLGLSAGMTDHNQSDLA